MAHADWTESTTRAGISQGNVNSTVTRQLLQQCKVVCSIRIPTSLEGVVTTAGTKVIDQVHRSAQPNAVRHVDD